MVTVRGEPSLELTQIQNIVWNWLHTRYIFTQTIRVFLNINFQNQEFIPRKAITSVLPDTESTSANHQNTLLNHVSAEKLLLVRSYVTLWRTFI